MTRPKPLDHPPRLEDLQSSACSIHTHDYDPFQQRIQVHSAKARHSGEKSWGNWAAGLPESPPRATQGFHGRLRHTGCPCLARTKLQIPSISVLMQLSIHDESVQTSPTRGLQTPAKREPFLLPSFPSPPLLSLYWVFLAASGCLQSYAQLGS